MCVQYIYFLQNVNKTLTNIILENSWTVQIVVKANLFGIDLGKVQWFEDVVKKMVYMFGWLKIQKLQNFDTEEMGLGLVSAEPR